MTDDERLLEALRITRDKELPPMHFLFRIFGKPCFPRGELVAVTGKAKSGKTLFNTLLMACCANSQALQVRRNPPEAADTDAPPEPAPIRVLWFDTEQSEQSTQDILKNRLLRMIEKGRCARNRTKSIQNLTMSRRTQIFNSPLYARRLATLHA